MCSEPGLEAFLLSLLFALLDIAASVAQFVITESVILKAGKDIIYSRFGNVFKGFFRKESLMGRNYNVRH